MCSRIRNVQWSFLIIAGFVISATHADCPNIISRRMWGSKENVDGNDLNVPVDYVIIQHTVSGECSTVTACADNVAGIQRYHINMKGYHDIAYNFLIGGDGNIYEGVGWYKVGTHSRSWNSKSLGISFIGNFSDKLPSQKALNAAKQLIQCALHKGELSQNYKLVGHRQVLATQSPGTRLYNEIVTWPHYAQTP